MDDDHDLQSLFDRFRHINEALEQKNVKLEDAIKLHEEGRQLEQKIRSILDAADRQVTEVLNPDGSREPMPPMTTTPLAKKGC